MDFERRIVCPENEELAAFMKNKWQEMSQNPKGISDNLNNTLYKAYSNVCNSKNPIKSLKELAEIKGVGKWMLKLMKGFFDSDSAVSGDENLPEKGKRKKGSRRYVPQKNSVAYALLITLYRETENGIEFMRKQELIDATEASGLSRAPIAPEMGKGKPGRFGSSPQSWYSGWNCMKTLITKGLVVKSSCPAKYMLTEEGKEAAQECLSRSWLVDRENSANLHIISGPEPRGSDIYKGGISVQGSALSNSSKEASLPSFHLNGQKKSIDIPPESLNKFIQMGFSREQTVCAFHEASETSKTQDISSLWPAVLCRLREYQVYGLPTQSHSTRDNLFAEVATCNFVSNSSNNRLVNTAESGALEGAKSSVLADTGLIASKSSDNRMTNTAQSGAFEGTKSSAIADSDHSAGPLKACSFTGIEALESKRSALAIPPLDFGETFEDSYGVILILDDRERFTNPRSNLRKIIDNISTQFRIPIEVRRLPVGDAIWVARHKSNGTEYVLDFVVERKKVDDLRLSIRDNRYRDQKLRLLRCGLKKVIYLVEGDPNLSDAAESIKTACFTTEILEGFDVQRTSGLGDTLKKYGYLTQAIYQYYNSLDLDHKNPRVCPPYGAFIRRCEDLDKMTVSDVFAIQLMQVPLVTEEVAIAVVEMYPTLLSLARAYSELDGDIRAQEEMLKKQSNDLISGAASRNIFQLIWGR